MIPLEKQVTSLEPSKRLKELGIKQDGLYSYFQYDKWNILLRETKEIYTPNNGCGCNKGNLICSTFTVAEHGEGLPQYVESYKIATDRFACKFCELEEDKKGNPVNGKPIIKVCDTEADARAKMRIYLIEHKLMETNE